MRVRFPTSSQQLSQKSHPLLQSKRRLSQFHTFSITTNKTWTMKPIIPPAMPPNIITKIISPTLMPDVYETSIICISLLILNHSINSGLCASTGIITVYGLLNHLYNGKRAYCAPNRSPILHIQKSYIKPKASNFHKKL